MIPESGQSEMPRGSLWTDWYKLDGHTPIPCQSEEDIRSIWQNNRVVRFDTLPNGVKVSTVFLGLDHSSSPSDGVPILFETMIFGGPHEGDQWRYATWDEAEKGHAEALILAQTEGSTALDSPSRQENEGKGLSGNS